MFKLQRWKPRVLLALPAPMLLMWLSHLRSPDILIFSRFDVCSMMFNATFNNISVISWRSVLLMEETGQNHRPVASHWRTLSHNDCIGSCKSNYHTIMTTTIVEFHCCFITRDGEYITFFWVCRLYNRETNLVPGLIPGVLQNRQGCIKIVYSQQWLSEFDLTGNFLSSYLPCLLCLCIKKLWLALSNEKWGHQFVYTIIQILSHDVDELYKLSFALSK